MDVPVIRYPTGAVHADLDHRVRQGLPDGQNTSQNERSGPVGIVDLAGAV